MFALASASLQVILSDCTDSVVSFSSEMAYKYVNTGAKREYKKEDKTGFDAVIFPIC